MGHFLGGPSLAAVSVPAKAVEKFGCAPCLWRTPFVGYLEAADEKRCSLRVAAEGQGLSEWEGYSILFQLPQE